MTKYEVVYRLHDGTVDRAEFSTAERAKQFASTVTAPGATCRTATLYKIEREYVATFTTEGHTTPLAIGG